MQCSTPHRRTGSRPHDLTTDARPPLALHPWPVLQPNDWVKWVNRRQTEAEVEAVRRSVVRARPYGSEAWQQQTAAGLGLEHTLRPRGRPKEIK